MNWTRGMLLTVLFTVVGMLLGVSPAAAQNTPNAVVYELTESMRIMGPNKAVRRAANSALAGWVQVGTPLCPKSLAVGLGIEKCTINIKASNRINLSTGKGPADGTFDIVVQDQNEVDAAEIPVINGRIDATMDLSAAIQQHAPWGTITGTWTADGVTGGPLATTRNLRGTFTGIFRLPVVVTEPPNCADADGNTSGCVSVSDPSYVMSDGTLYKLKPVEFSLGIPTVKLEIILR